MSDDQDPPEYPPPPPPKLEQPRHGGNHMFMSPRNQPERDAWAAARWQLDSWIFKDIAAALDVPVSGAYNAVQRGLRASREITEAAAEKARAMHRARLERATEVAEEVMEKDHLHVSHGQVVKGSDGAPILDDGPKLAAAGKVRELSESMRKLDGLDQPTKVEHTGGVKYELIGIDPKDLR